MIPYVQIPEVQIVSANVLGLGWPAAPISIRPFGVLVVLAVVLGIHLSLRQARRLDLSRRRVIALVYFVIIGGFVGGHLFEVAFYSPELIGAEPAIWLSFAQGQSSFGGFIGATAGVFIYRGMRGGPLLGLAEVLASSFPAAWIVGRIGCAVAHDHPGVRSGLWFAVAYPAGGRFDLGLIEAVAVLPLAAAFLWLRNKPRPAGFFVATMCLYYGVVRFCLDFLRANDVIYPDCRYFSLTPAQWGAFLLIGLGVYFSSFERSRTALRNA